MPKNGANSIALWDTPDNSILDVTHLWKHTDELCLFISHFYLSLNVYGEPA
jgi:hypothetical protein